MDAATVVVGTSSRQQVTTPAAARGCRDRFGCARGPPGQRDRGLLVCAVVEVLGCTDCAGRCRRVMATRTGPAALRQSAGRITAGVNRASGSLARISRSRREISQFGPGVAEPGRWFAEVLADDDGGVSGVEGRPPVNQLIWSLRALC